MWFRPAYPPKGPETDLEAGPAGVARPLYPAMTERPELRWAFIRKVYSIVSFQMLLTVAVGASVVYYRPIAHYFVSGGAGLGLYILTFLMPFIVLPFLYWYNRRYPWNMLLLGIFTISISFAVGLTWKVILESVMLTAVVVISLTVYTFWAARRGHDFRFLGPFLFSAIMILLVYALIQLFLPMSRISLSIYGALAAVIFSGYII
ncbi:hypothetical protein LUZ63_005616 [Rhynchospora breviuscula]|uniref:BI1-like protein n=1 Tax=Rhynchospora breviuscula TaxID=2022672 RepID=A0A9Q0CN75_9POAL|nr:hypothetical protein LUZ63_005616 [Rhynchospora breviuscula]